MKRNVGSVLEVGQHKPRLEMEGAIVFYLPSPLVDEFVIAGKLPSLPADVE